MTILEWSGKASLREGHLSKGQQKMKEQTTHMSGEKCSRQQEWQVQGP